MFHPDHTLLPEQFMAIIKAMGLSASSKHPVVFQQEGFYVAATITTDRAVLRILEMGSIDGRVGMLTIGNFKESIGYFLNSGEDYPGRWDLKIGKTQGRTEGGYTVLEHDERAAMPRTSSTGTPINNAMISACASLASFMSRDATNTGLYCAWIHRDRRSIIASDGHRLLKSPWDIVWCTGSGPSCPVEGLPREIVLAIGSGVMKGACLGFGTHIWMYGSGWQLACDAVRVKGLDARQVDGVLPGMSDEPSANISRLKLQAPLADLMKANKGRGMDTVALCVDRLSSDLWVVLFSEDEFEVMRVAGAVSSRGNPTQRLLVTVNSAYLRDHLERGPQGRTLFVFGDTQSPRFYTGLWSSNECVTMGKIFDNDGEQAKVWEAIEAHRSADEGFTTIPMLDEEASAETEASAEPVKEHKFTAEQLKYLIAAERMGKVHYQKAGHPFTTKVVRKLEGVGMIERVMEGGRAFYDATDKGRRALNQHRDKAVYKRAMERFKALSEAK